MNEDQDISYRTKVEKIHLELGIASNYASVCGLELQAECQQLVLAESDVFKRQALLERNTFQAWSKMRAAAKLMQVELLIISAYRSADYQQQLLQNKLTNGQCLADILKINAAPGYSEHHTGRALDIGCPDYEHLNESFENSPAFRWLSENAKGFGFTMSFPKNNIYGFLYEPWHWQYSE